MSALTTPPLALYVHFPWCVRKCPYCDFNSYTPAETRRAAEELHAAGLANFNLDLMYALPGQDVPAARLDLAGALELQPAHVSHYQLTIEPGTVFAARRPPLPDEDAATAMLDACAALLGEAGLAQYEVSAYARPGRQCRHNLNYWRFGDYLGVGAGAHGKLTFPYAGQIVRTLQPDRKSTRLN